MRLAMAIALAVCLTGGMATPRTTENRTAAALQAGDAFTFQYEAYFGGALIGEARSTLRLSKTRYTMELHALSAGLLDWFITFDQLATSGGALKAVPVAERHRNHNRTRGNWVELRFTGDTVEVVAANSQPEEDDKREPVPADLLKGTMDPLSAMLAAGIAVQTNDQCDSVTPVFDGRRRYNTILEARGRETYTGPAGPAVALICGFRFERIAGYPADAKKWAPITGAVWLQQVGAGLPFLPVRMEVETRYGTAYIHMVSASRDG